MNRHSAPTRTQPGFFQFCAARGASVGHHDNAGERRRALIERRVHRAMKVRRRTVWRGLREVREFIFELPGEGAEANCALIARCLRKLRGCFRRSLPAAFIARVFRPHRSAAIHEHEPIALGVSVVFEPAARIQPKDREQDERRRSQREQLRADAAAHIAPATSREPDADADKCQRKRHSLGQPQCRIPSQRGDHAATPVL